MARAIVADVMLNATEAVAWSVGTIVAIVALDVPIAESSHRGNTGILSPAARPSVRPT